MSEEEQGSANNQSSGRKNKHPFLKKLGIILLVIFAIIFIISKVSTYRLEKNTLNAFISTNKMLTNQDITIDSVDTNVLAATTNVYRMTIYNPPGYISPFALYIGQIEIIATFDLDTQLSNLIVKNVTFKDVKINYDMNAKSFVNLYQLIDNMTQSLAPAPRFSPLLVLNTAQVPLEKPLRYDGAKFFIDKIVIEKPTINIFNNRRLIKTIGIDNIALTYENIKQPANYADIILASSLQVMDKLDRAVLK